MRPFFLCLKPSEREKETTTQPSKETNPQSQKSSRAGESRTRGQEKKTKGQKDKKQGKHATSPKTAKHLTRTKATQATQSTQAKQIHTEQGKRAKNPLRMRNRAIFAGNTPQTKRESGQKAGNTRPEDQRQPIIGPESPKGPAHSHQWTPPPPQSEGPNGSPAILESKIYLCFCPFWSPKFPRKHQAKQEKIHFCHFLHCLSENLPRWEEEKGGGKQDEIEPRSLCREHTKRDTPPLAERQEPFTPIIFRTKNTEKSQPTLGKKISEKICGENVSGKKESPQSYGEGAKDAKV